MFRENKKSHELMERNNMEQVGTYETKGYYINSINPQQTTEERWAEYFDTLSTYE